MVNFDAPEVIEPKSTLGYIKRSESSFLERQSNREINKENEENDFSLGRALVKHHIKHANSSLIPSDSHELLFPNSLQYKSGPSDLMMPLIDEEEETKIDIGKVEAYTYVKNE